MRQWWPPSRSNCLLSLAVVSAGYFLVETLLHQHPDGAILGFSAAIWAAWDNEVLQQRRRKARRRRRSIEERERERREQDEDDDGGTDDDRES